MTPVVTATIWIGLAIIGAYAAFWIGFLRGQKWTHRECERAGHNWDIKERQTMEQFIAEQDAKKATRLAKAGGEA